MSTFLVMSFLHDTLCSEKTSNYYVTVIDNDEALKILKIQSLAARELYDIWKQSIDNTDSMKEKMRENLSLFLVRITVLNTRLCSAIELLD